MTTPRAALERLTAAAVPLDDGRVAIRSDPRRLGNYDPTEDLELVGLDYVVGVSARGFRFEFTPPAARPDGAATR